MRPLRLIKISKLNRGRQILYYFSYLEKLKINKQPPQTLTKVMEKKIRFTVTRNGGNRVDKGDQQV